jgi:aryl-alcohol dehydrogenase-like predicted oxidoreductase
MKRRDFIHRMAVIGMSAAASGSIMADLENAPGRQLPRRKYGRHDDELSVVGFGGIVVMNVEQSEANDYVAWAVDRGCNYFDVAPSYGNAQDRLGPALKPYRDKCFLACKTGKRDAAGALEELENSLRVLQTDHFDLYQLHGITSVEETEQCFAPGGAMETFAKAREQGKVRYLGFSAHSHEAALKALESFPFDSVLFPLNAVCWHNGNFGPAVVEKAQEKGAALLSLKALAWTPWPEGARRRYEKAWYQPQDDRELARLLVGFTLGLPVTALVPSGHANLFKLAVHLASRYQPLTEEDKGKLAQAIEGVKPIFQA